MPCILTSTFFSGYRMGDKKIKAICYADDVVLISENEDNLQRLLYKFEQTAPAFNMLISTSKTQCLTIAKEPLRYKLAVYGKSIEQVMNFKNLSVTITSSRERSKSANIKSFPDIGLSAGYNMAKQVHVGR